MLSNVLSTECVKRWIEAGYDLSYIESDPEAVRFFGTSDFRPIRMYDVAKSQLLLEKKEDEVGLHFEKGKVLFKVKGQWTLYSQIKDSVRFDPAEKKFPRWTYVHPESFVRNHASGWTKLHTCAQLSPRAHAVLQKVANKFWENHPTIDPDEEKPYIFQAVIVDDTKEQKGSPLLKNFTKMMSLHHCHIRLIDTTGKVYSFGWGIHNKKDLSFIFDGGARTLLSTTNAALTSPDYQEPLEVTHSDTVSIPISKTRFDAIKDTAERINRDIGHRFCMTNSNCSWFTQQMLKICGVTINTRMTIPQCLVRMMPDAEDIPFFGRPLCAIMRIISFVFKGIQRFFFCIVPSSLKQIFSRIRAAVFFIPEKLLIFFCSLVCVLLGGTKGNESRIQNCPSATSDADGARTYQTRLVDTFWSLFKQRTLFVFHSNVLKEWARAQKSYQSFDNQLSGLCIVKMDP